MSDPCPATPNNVLQSDAVSLREPQENELTLTFGVSFDSGEMDSDMVVLDRVPGLSLAWLARRGDGPPLRGIRPQEPKWADEELAFLQRYAALVAAGERAPAKMLSEEYAITERAVHNRLSRLRNRGMLTRPGPGAAGGKITPKARTAIRNSETASR